MIRFTDKELEKFCASMYEYKSTDKLTFTNLNSFVLQDLFYFVQDIAFDIGKYKIGLYDPSFIFDLLVMHLMNVNIRRNKVLLKRKQYNNIAGKYLATKTKIIFDGLFPNNDICLYDLQSKFNALEQETISNKLEIEMLKVLNLRWFENMFALKNVESIDSKIINFLICNRVASGLLNKALYLFTMPKKKRGIKNNAPHKYISLFIVGSSYFNDVTNNNNYNIKRNNNLVSKCIYYGMIHVIHVCVLCCAKSCMIHNDNFTKFINEMKVSTFSKTTQSMIEHYFNATRDIPTNYDYKNTFYLDTTYDYGEKDIGHWEQYFCNFPKETTNINIDLDKFRKDYDASVACFNDAQKQHIFSLLFRSVIVTDVGQTFGYNLVDYTRAVWDECLTTVKN
jgi:hypothetical protein